MNHQHAPKASAPPSTIDPTLTPKNAKQKGYEYIDDIIYSEYMSQAATKHILKLINQHGYKLGAPSVSKESNIYRGLYMPIKEKY